MPSVLVYRDRLLAPPETFVPRQYVGFTRLQPLFVGCRRDSALGDIHAPTVVVGELPAVTRLDVLLFRQLGRVPEPLLQVARAHDVQVIHAQFGRGGALALPLAKALGVPLVVTFHGGDANKDTHYRRRLFPTIFQRRWLELQRSSRKFLCVSAFVQQQLLKRGVRSDLLEVHHLGVVMPTDPPPRPSRTNRLLGVGRFVPKKGFEDTIKALRLARAQGILLELDLIGDGPLRGELEAASRDLPVRFLGWKQPADVALAMADALALVVPSRTASGGDAEGLPTVVLEAQAHRLPVIATRHAGIPEAVTDEQTGLLVAEGDVEGLAGALVRLRQDATLGERLAAAALQSVHANFDARRQSERLEDLLLEFTHPRHVLRAGNAAPT